MEKNVNFTTAPADAYTFTSPYWEASELDSNGQTEKDYWQFELPDGSASDWDLTGTLRPRQETQPATRLASASQLGDLLLEPIRHPDQTGSAVQRGRFAQAIDIRRLVAAGAC